MLKRWGDAIGYCNVAATAVEAIFRVPQRPEPPSKFAEAVWSSLPASLAGKTFAITGSSRGLGFVLARRIASRGGNLILLNRASKNAEGACAELSKLSGGGSVTQIDCDLLDFASVKRAAAEMRTSVKRSSSYLDCLVLNAGLMAMLDARTEDGFDPQMQANHLSHFLLTSLVWDLLEAAAARPDGLGRVVSHSSGARHSPDVELRPDSFEKAWADGSPCAGDAQSRAKWARYQQSKRANLAFTYALADHIERKGSRVKALCAHPGATNSGLQSRTDAASWMDRFINGLAVVAGQSSEDGCLGLSLATVKDQVANGDFFGPSGLTGDAVLLPSEREWRTGYSEEQLSLLWAKSVAATGAEW